MYPKINSLKLDGLDEDAQDLPQIRYLRDGLAFAIIRHPAAFCLLLHASYFDLVIGVQGSGRRAAKIEKINNFGSKRNLYDVRCTHGL